MSFFAIQFFNGLSHATTLFLMAAGLTLIFGVTRIVNFAHGSFYMLGAMVSATIVTIWLPSWGESAWGYAGAMLIGAGCAAALGALVEVLLLRRMLAVPELYQLVATFGLSLFMHDAMLWAFGPDEVFAPRFPGLKGSIEVAGEFLPVWHIVTIVLGPLVWLGLHLLLTKTTWGQRLRAATADRAMLAALGINPAPLVLGAVALGCGLAGLGGALRLPSEPANLQMDVNVVVETFVVVVTGGLGSISGAFLAALLIGMVHALGVSFFPQATLVVVFVTMAVVLALRPQGLMGSALDAESKHEAKKFDFSDVEYSKLATKLIVIGVLAAMLTAWLAGDYWQALALDVLILAIFGISLQSMMALGGLVSFGHAAFFALGAYGAALSHMAWGVSLPWALAAGCCAALAAAALFGALVVRSAGVYLAMLSLALAQVVWATATQWTQLTGGDNGVIGLSLVTEDTRGVFYGLVCGIALLSVAALGYSSQTRFGAALQAARDAPARAAASGLPVGWLRYRAFVESAVLAGLAGGLFAAHKGAVFPSSASVGMSVDALLVTLLGGVHWVWGALMGSALLTVVQAELGRSFAYWRGALGLLVMLLMVWAPTGLGGWRARIGRSGASRAIKVAAITPK
jgi:branched-chain amino acid transport system permease protein